MKTDNNYTPAELLAMIVRNTAAIQAHLRSIRNMLTFFTVLIVLDMLYQLIAAFFR